MPIYIFLQLGERKEEENNREANVILLKLQKQKILRFC